MVVALCVKMGQLTFPLDERRVGAYHTDEYVSVTHLGGLKDLTILTSLSL